MKTWRGNRPEGPEWIEVYDVRINDEEWIVVYKPQQHTDDWVTYKVFANGRVAHKANYWFVRNVNTGVFGKSTDIRLMIKNRPELWAAIQDGI